MRLLGRGNRRLGRQSILPSPRAFLFILFFAPQAVFAADRVWTATTNTTWGTNSNWTGGPPSAGDNAEFNSAFNNQRNPAGNPCSGAIWMTGGLEHNVTSSDSRIPLPLTGKTINGTAGLGFM